MLKQEDRCAASFQVKRAWIPYRPPVSSLLLLTTRNTDVVTGQPPCDVESVNLLVRWLQSRKQESELESTMKQPTEALDCLL